MAGRVRSDLAGHYAGKRIPALSRQVPGLSANECRADGPGKVRDDPEDDCGQPALPRWRSSGVAGESVRPSAAGAFYPDVGRGLRRGRMLHPLA